MKMKRILLLLSVLAISAAYTFAQMANVTLTPERKLAFAQQLIAKYYVDRIDTTKVVEDAIIAMLKDLDPHSTYSNADETRELTEPLEGNFSGIGIRFQMDHDTLYVVESIAGGPSERVGIIPGDRILSCNDTVISGVKKSNADILKVLRGPRGTTALLKVLRKGSTEPLEFAVKRDDIPIYSVDATYMVNDSVGFISVARFAGTTAQEVNDAMKTLKSQGMKHLIIDLCDNGGGYLKSSTDIANNFLRKGDLIVYTDSPQNGSMRYEAIEDGKDLDGRVVVMVNQYSASASEILSGALQDNDRAVIVGRRTFGKGLVQRPFPFPDGSMIRLTVARYHTPSGRCIQKPYTDGDDDAYRNDIVNRYKSGELTSADSINLPDSLRYSTLRLNRPVYGGGGIMPDRFVPIDTTFYTDYYRDLVAKGVISNYSLRYVDEHRAALKKRFKTEKDFIDTFEVTPEIMQGLIDLGNSDGVEFKQEAYDTSRSYIEAILKGLIGRDLFEQSTYQKVLNPFNNIYNAAVEIITDPAKYDSYLKP